ncbi:MAG: methyltransferase domain-containing protein [Candidatus Bathyarchaeia archaeon]|jgi:trans-aconitate methyltransferase
MAKNYVWNAKDYQKNSTNQYAWAQELIPKLNLHGNETLLDIGCGDGKITAEIAKALPNGRVVGIDSSPDMINLAQTLFPLNDYPNLSFQLADARNFVFQAIFDRVFSNAALHWIPNQSTVLFCVEKCLKPQGKLLFQMAGKGNAQNILNILDEMLTLEPWRQYFAGFKFPYGFFDAKEYAAFLEKADLKPLRLELFPKDMKLQGAEGLAGWVRTTWLPFTEKLPNELKTEFVEELATRYLQKHPADVDGTVHVKMVRLEVQAQKP